MIQRIQTVWLLLAGICSLLMYRLPLWECTPQGRTAPEAHYAPESLLLFILLVCSALLAFSTVFLFRNRRLQQRLCLLGMLLGAAMLGVEFMRVEDLRATLTPVSNRWREGGIMPVLTTLLFLLSLRGVRNDERIIRSLERLR